MKTFAGAAALTIVLGLSACSLKDDPASSSGPDATASSAGPPRSPMEDFPVGSSAPFAVYAHCGVEFTKIDGTTWRTAPRNDGQGNPPKGWPQSLRGTLTRPTDDRAEFVAADVPETFVFKPAANAKFCCA